MIEAHVIDSWTRLDARHSWQFTWAMILGGFGAPLFLFLAGVSVALSAASKMRRTGRGQSRSASAVMRRGLVYLLRWHSRSGCRRGSSASGRRHAPEGGHPQRHGAFDRRRCGALGQSPQAAVARARIWCVALAVALLAPLVRHTPLLDGWPDALQGYLRPLRAVRISACFHGQDSSSPGPSRRAHCRSPDAPGRRGSTLVFLPAGPPWRFSRTGRHGCPARIRDPSSGAARPRFS